MWEYYDGRNQNLEWYDDRTISINCIGKYISCFLYDAWIYLFDSTYNERIKIYCDIVAFRD